MKRFAFLLFLITLLGTKSLCAQQTAPLAVLVSDKNLISLFRGNSEPVKEMGRQKLISYSFNEKESTSVVMVKPTGDPNPEKIHTNAQTAAYVTTGLIAGGVTLMLIGAFNRDPNSSKVSPLVPIGAVIALTGIIPFFVSSSGEQQDTYAHH